MKTILKYDPEWKETIEQVHEMVSNFPNHRLKNNYSPEALMIEEWHAVSIYDGGFSSLSWRPIWNNSCRILNRFYRDPSYRFGSHPVYGYNDPINQYKLNQLHSRVTNETYDMVKQQIDAAKKLGFDFAFMSRESVNPKVFHHNEKYLDFVEWVIPENRYKMLDDETSKSCWQYIMGTHIYNYDKKKIDIPYITEEKYNALHI